MLHKNVLEPQTFQPKKETSMFKPAMAIAALIACSVPAVAATDYPSARMHTALPSEAMTVTDWYKQNVYDPNENKIGDVKDVLVDKSGKVVALIVGVGGFLGAGEKDVAVPFEAVHPTVKDKKWWLVMNTTKDSLKNAPGFKYDSNTTTWVPDRP
jgi:sporulation protein YlmC with PRC-barrel domain